MIYLARATSPGPHARRTAAPRRPAARRRRAPAGQRPGDLAPRTRLVILVAAIVVLSVGFRLLLSSRGDTQGVGLAAQFASSWARGDYAQMYADVDAATRRSIPIGAFAAHYRDALATSTATAVRTGPAQLSGHGSVTVPITLHTRIFGTLSTSFVLPIRHAGGATTIAWRPSLSFPGLRDGETLSRRTSLAPRATLLARDGTPLTRLAAVRPIIGSLGPIPAARAQLLRDAGYPSGAIVGVSGLQLIFDQKLAGTPGGELFAGFRVLASSTPRPATALRTSLSPPLQSLAVATLGGQEGGIVLMTPGSGEILAVAGNPFSELQPPGSTFKLVTLTGVLLSGLAKPDTTFPYATFATIDGFKLQNANGESCGGTLANAFAVSCNSVFAPLGVRLGGARLVDAARRFGFNSPSPIPGAAQSTLPGPATIGSALDVGSSAIGQGNVQASTLQMTLVAATIADGGSRPVPTLALGVRHPKPTVIPSTVARSVTAMMVGVVNHGTGTAARIPGVVVAGKTGTAELGTTAPTCTVDPTNPTPCPPPPANDPTKTDAWFVAFAPTGAPRVVVGVLLAQDGAGGDTAAPVAKVMLQAGLRASAGARRSPSAPPAGTGAPGTHPRASPAGAATG